jgi:hypothetical protein
VSKDRTRELLYLSSANENLARVSLLPWNALEARWSTMTMERGSVLEYYSQAQWLQDKLELIAGTIP